ncbi:MAG TPA: DinB family protein [Gemmatimonadaceae bacterium]|nr:DinB family protein [Gemmatimonadaceae bacterium]
MPPEVWLRGPLPGISPTLMPAAHCLLQCREEIARAASGLTTEQLWARPAGVASVGFHLRHIVGSLDRLLTYARGEQLGRSQLSALRAEGEPGEPPEDAASLIAGADRAIDSAVEVLRNTPDSDLFVARVVGRAGLPSNVLGLLFHCAEHTHRHTGQLVTTAKLVA